MANFKVELTRVIKYHAVVEAHSALDAGVLVGDMIRADENSRAPRTIVASPDDPEVLVEDHGLGEMSVLRLAEAAQA